MRIFHSWRAIWQYIARSLKNKYVKFYPEVGIYPEEIISQVDKDEYTKIFNATVYVITVIDTIIGKNPNEQGIGDINCGVVIKWNRI